MSFEDDTVRYLKENKLKIQISQVKMVRRKKIFIFQSSFQRESNKSHTMQALLFIGGGHNISEETSVNEAVCAVVVAAIDTVALMDAMVDAKAAMETIMGLALVVMAAMDVAKLAIKVMVQP